MHRRVFIKTSVGAAASVGAVSMTRLASAASAPARADPRWRGFNLLEFFSGDECARAFRESDFETIAA